MAAASLIGRTLELIASELATLPGVSWGTPPAAIWYPEFDRADLKTYGLQAYVLAPDASQPLEQRAGNRMRNVMVHVAVIDAIATKTFDEADTVIETAEAVENHLVRKHYVDGTLHVACNAGSIEPVLSSTHAKEQGLNVSYVKLEITAGDIG